MGAFSAKFSTTPIVAKLYQKVWGWNDGMDHLYHHAKFGGNQTTHAGMRGWSVMFFTFFVNNARTLNSHKWRSCVIQEEIMSVFVGQFRWGLQCFFSEKKSPFQWMEQIWKLSLCGATISAPMRRKIFKIWENGCKVCAHHFDYLEARWKKSQPQNFTPCIVDVHPYKNILLPRYRVPRKTVKFVAMVPKHVIGPTFVRTKSLLSRAIFKNVLGAFYRGWYVVVHPCSNFSLWCQMAPLRSIKFQTADFLIFCERIIVIFWTTCIAREVFSVVVMGNGKHVLLLLHCLKRGIAFVSCVCNAAYLRICCMYTTYTL